MRTAAEPAQCENNMSTTANALGIARPTLYKLINKYELKLEAID